MAVQRLAILALFLLKTSLCFAAPTVSSVSAVQRTGTKLVDITYNLTAPGVTEVMVSLEISSDGGTTWTVPVTSASGTGIGNAVTPGENSKKITWDAGVDWNHRSSSQMRFRVTAAEYIPLNLPAINGTPNDDAVPAGWVKAQNTPDIIAGEGLWPGNSTIRIMDIGGSSTNGGQMAMFAMWNSSWIERMSSTATGLVSGKKYVVAFQWQQATIRELVWDGNGNSWHIYKKGGQFGVMIDGMQKVFTSTGTVSGDTWQTLVVPFTAKSTTAVITIGNVIGTGEGCIVADSATPPPATATGTSGNAVVSTLTVAGRVLDATTGEPLAGAHVTLAGESTTSAIDGTFTFANANLSVSDEVTVSKTGYASKTIITGDKTGVADLNVGDIHLQADSTITIHRLEPDAIANIDVSSGASGYVDEPLIPTKSLEQLVASTVKPPVQGLVADDVTPLLMHLKNRNQPTAPNYRITATVLSGGSVMGGLTARINVLQNGIWKMIDTNGEHRVTPAELTPIDTDKHVFICLNAIPAEAVMLTFGSKELTCELKAEELDIETGNPTGKSTVKSFKIRKPPIVLVHGFNANSSTWSPAFLAELEASRVVKRIDYGVTVAVNGWASNSRNTNGRLDELAAVLDDVLKEQVESPTSPFLNNWAMTRYDVVAHSQGGVLTRMLCQNVGTDIPLFARTPFRDSSNHYRGRFRRVITIGSPHNGTRTAYYLLKLQETGYLALPYTLEFFGLLQPKFDPYGEQIRKINNPLSYVDPSAKFHLVTSAIDGGDHPKLDAIVPLCYWTIPGLNNPPNGSIKTRGETVLPRGSDGVVDWDSAAGAPSNKTSPMDSDICHAPAPWWAGGYTFFAVGYGNSQTNEPKVAVKALNLLDGPAKDIFGPFVLPKLLTDQSEIDNILPSVLPLELDLILLSTSGAEVSRGLVQTATTTNSYSYKLRPNISDPLQGKVSWFAEAFTANGVSTDGITVQVNETDSTLVTVTVDGSVQGDVVLYAHYFSTTGKLIVAKPIVLVSRPKGATLTAIEILPSTVGLAIGQTQRFDIYGTYDTGARSPLFFEPDSGLKLVSSNPAVASLDANNVLTANSPGITTVTATYNGLTAKQTVGIHGPPLKAAFTSETSVPVTANTYSAAGNTVSFELKFAPKIGTNLKVVENTGTDFIHGTYSNLSHGQEVIMTFEGISYSFVANYYGGTGNDLVLLWANTMLLGWGDNEFGQLDHQLGEVDYVEARTIAGIPILVKKISIPMAVNPGILYGKAITSVAAGAGHSLALCADGTLSAWGNNDYGQLGNSRRTPSGVPMSVNMSGILSGKTVVSIVAGAYHSLALCSDGTMAAWGRNENGELGTKPLISPTINSDDYVPAKVITTGALSGKTVTAIAAGGRHSLALCSDGTVAGWGLNSSGQLGNNSTNNSSVPVLVNMAGALAGKRVVAIAAGADHSLALCSDGTLVSWGLNYDGQLGNNSTNNSSVPVLVNMAGALAGKRVVAIAAGADHSLALCSDGTLVSWGWNLHGQLGNGNMTDSPVPVLVSTVGVLSGRKVITVSAGRSHSLALCSDGTLAAWGSNRLGQLGNNGIRDGLDLWNWQRSEFPAAVDTSSLISGERFVCIASGCAANFTLSTAYAPPKPILDTLAASAVNMNGATLNGIVNANGLDTAVSFEYGLTRDYGMKVLSMPGSVSGNTPTNVTANISGLTPGTTYHYRILGIRSGTAYGADLTFTTLGQMGSTVPTPPTGLRIIQQ